MYGTYCALAGSSDGLGRLSETAELPRCLRLVKLNQLGGVILAIFVYVWAFVLDTICIIRPENLSLDYIFWFNFFFFIILYNSLSCVFDSGKDIILQKHPSNHDILNKMW